jgi:hypothetical protein
MNPTDRICRILEEAAAAEPGSVHPSTALGEIDGWDSMGVVFFLGEAALHWPQVRIASDDVAACRTVADLARLVQA